MLKKNGALILITLYLLGAIAYALSPFSKPAVIGLTTFVGEAGMDVLICILAIRMYFITNNNRSRLFGIIAAAYFCECIADGAYNLLQNVLNISNPTTFIASFFEIPFLSFLCLQAWLWWELFSESNTNKRMPLLAYAPFMVSALLVITIFIYFAGWKIDRLSGEGLYQLADIFAEAVGFALVSISLGTSSNKAFSSIAIGFLVIVCSNYMIRLPVVALATTQNSPYEFSWIAGQLLVFYGLSRLKQDYPDNPPNNWCYGVNCLQSQIVVGCFSLELLAIALFSIFLKYATPTAPPDGSILKYLPPLMMILSIIIVILSSYFSKKLLKPLKELEATIESYSTPGGSQFKLNSHDDYGIREYVELKTFINQALISMNEKLTIERETSALAASVAHDITSPLAVMEIILHAYSNELSANLSSTLKDSIQRIRNISYNLLEKYRNPTYVSISGQTHHGRRDTDTSQTPCPVFLPYITELAVSQKRLEWTAKPCEIMLNINLKENTGWILTAPETFKRVISNLLNNAYEALQTNRLIAITLSHHFDTFFSLSIDDTGCGIGSEQLPKALNGESFKHAGKGLGLSGAKAYIEALGGNLFIASREGEGTKIELLFPMASN